MSSITIQANNSSASYAWLNCDDNFSIISGETNQSYTPSVNGNYAVKLMENGCTDTSACVAITAAGIIENDFGEELLVFPNPTDGNFKLLLGGIYEDVKITITDISGKVVQHYQFNNKQIVDIYEVFFCQPTTKISKIRSYANFFLG